MLDQATNSCVIDPTSCGSGTVYIMDKGCVDPTEGLTVDVTEGAEPNGLGIVEDSTNPAGQLTLKAEGQVLVVKGTINPFRDDNGDGEIDADFDTYVFATNGPALIEVSVDGTNGLAGAFLAISGNEETADWQRYGLNVTGDKSQRQLWLPGAGVYGIAIGDTRSMYLDGTSPPAAGAGGAAGSADAHYFMSIKVLPTPTPTAVTLTGGAAAVSGELAPGEVKFYSASMGLGINALELDMPGSASASLVLSKNNAFKAMGNEEADIFGTYPAAVTAPGFRATDTALMAVDTTYHYGPSNAAYTLAIKAGDAGELSTSGGSAMQPEDDEDFSVFYYDVAAADEIRGFNLTFDQRVVGVIVDEDMFIAARFNYGANGFVNQPWDTFKGLVRHRAAGRYYLLVFDPAGTGANTLTATSTHAPVTATAVVTGTPLTGQALSAYGINPYSYNAGTTDLWQSFNTTGTGTGDITSTFYASTAYGRFGTLNVASAAALPVDATAAFSYKIPEAGAAKGRILADATVTQYFVTVAPTTTTGAPTFGIDFKRRDHVDFGTIAAGNMQSRTNETIDATTQTRYYLFRTNGGNRVTITSHPVGALTLNSRIQLLNADESVRQTVNNGLAGADDVYLGLQGSAGWTAFAISSTSALVAAENYDVTVATGAPIQYTVANGTTAYADACAGGTPITLTDDDEGSSAAINTPAGFDFYGFPSPQLKVFANGFVSFDTSLTCGTTCFFSNGNIPLAATPNALAAPYWDDLELVEACQKTVGGKLVIQWTGQLYTSPSPAVAFQLILDPTNDSMEFVYSPTHVPTGGAATIGIEDQAGANAQKIGFDTANVITPGMSKLLTPN